SAGQGEQREHQPDERRIDVERLGDPAADARQYPVVRALLEAGESHRAHRTARAPSICPAPTSASITSSGAPRRPGRETSLSTSRPFSWTPSTSLSPQST